MKLKSYSVIIIIVLILLNSNILRSKTKWRKLYFTDPDKCDEQVNNPQLNLIYALDNAKKSFYGAFYSISSPKIIAALIRAHDRGIDVKLVVERDNLAHPMVTHLIKAGIPMVTDDRNGLMHHKFAIIDKRFLWTGSFNLTSNGSCANNNNAIQIYSLKLAEIYLNEFNEMFKHGIFVN